MGSGVEDQKVARSTRNWEGWIGVGTVEMGRIVLLGISEIAGYVGWQSVALGRGRAGYAVVWW